MASSTSNDGEISPEEQIALEVAKISDLIDKAKATKNKKKKAEFLQQATELTAIVSKLDVQLIAKKASADTSTTAPAKDEDTVTTMPPQQPAEYDPGAFDDTPQPATEYDPGAFDDTPQPATEFDPGAFGDETTQPKAEADNGAWNENNQWSAEADQAANETDDAPSTIVLDIPVDVKSTEGVIEPTRTNSRAAVLRYSSNSQVYCYGQLDYVKANAGIVKVVLRMATRGQDDPYMCLDIRFPRDADSPASFSKPSDHAVKVKFMPRKYKLDGHMVTDDTEIAELFQSLPENLHLKAKEAISKRTLVRLNISFAQNALELNGYPWAWYETTNAEVRAKFEGLHGINQCEILTVFVWHWDQMVGNFEFLRLRQEAFESPLNHWYHQEKQGAAAYVQWGKIKPLPTTESALNPKFVFHDYADYNLTIGNGIAYEAQLEIDLVKKLRNVPIKMSVLQVPNSGGRGPVYIYFFQIPEFGTIQKTIETARRGLITFSPFHPVKVQDLVEGEKLPRDNPKGWDVYFQTDTIIQHGADIMAFGIRPEDPENPFWDMEMPAAMSLNDDLPSQIVYLKLYPNSEMPNLQIKTLDKLRFCHTKGDVKAEMMRSMLIGRYVENYQTEDLLATLNDGEISHILNGLTPSQRSLFTTYLRHVINGIALCHGPFGTGKTAVIKVLARIMAKDNKRMLCVTSRNAGCDHIVECLKQWQTDIFCVRLHSMRLEGRSITQHARLDLKRSLLPADPELELPEEDDAVEFSVGPKGAEEYYSSGTANVPRGLATEERIATSDNDRESNAANDEDEAEEEEWGTVEDPVENWNHDDIVIKYTEHLMHTAEQKWRERSKYTNPTDPRMVLTDSAIWTYILKFIGVIPSNYHTTYWSGFVSLYEKSKTQLLNKHEQRLFSKDLLTVGRDIINQARVIVCTPAQLASPLMENIDFDLGFIDEATTMNEAEFVMVWKVCRNVLAVGDTKQLGATIMSKATDNPFRLQIEKSFFARLIEIGWGFHSMVETMRMTKGLFDLPNHLFYDNTLISGAGTDLKDREISRKWQALASRLYPHLTPEPNGLIYPVFLNVPGVCKPPSIGALSFHNLQNVAVVWDLIDSILNAEVVTTKDIGICCLYAAQVAAHNRVVRARGGEFRNVRVGTVEFWRGREAFVMISDAVRAENDAGTLGFFCKSERLNVWMSRCQHAQIFVGDTLCVKLPPNVGGEWGEDKASKRLEQQNKHVIRMFKWLESKGRIVRISMDKIPNSDVEYDDPQTEIPAGGNAADEWAADAAGKKAAGGEAADGKTAGDWAVEDFAPDQDIKW